MQSGQPCVPRISSAAISSSASPRSVAHGPEQSSTSSSRFHGIVFTPIYTDTRAMPGAPRSASSPDVVSIGAWSMTVPVWRPAVSLRT